MKAERQSLNPITNYNNNYNGNNNYRQQLIIMATLSTQTSLHSLNMTPLINKTIIINNNGNSVIIRIVLHYLVLHDIKTYYHILYLMSDRHNVYS